MFDYILRGLISLHNFTIEQIIDDFLLDFIILQLKKDMSLLAPNYYKIFTDRMLEAYNFTYNNDEFVKTRFIKQIISTELRYMSKKIFEIIDIFKDEIGNNNNTDFQKSLLEKYDFTYNGAEMRYVNDSKTFFYTKTIHKIVLSDSEINDIFNICIPLKDLYTFSYMIGFLSLSVRKVARESFLRTHRSISKAFASVVAGADPVIEYPMLYNNTNNPQAQIEEIGDYVYKALVTTPILLAKGIVEVLDPNIAITKSVLTALDSIEAIRNLGSGNTEQDRLIKLIKFPITSLGFSLSGIPPGLIGIAYLTLQLFKERGGEEWFRDFVGVNQLQTNNLPRTCKDV